MKLRTSVVILTIILLLVLAAPVLANNGLPDTAVGAVGLLITFLGTVFGVGSVTNVFTDIVKDAGKYLPFLADVEKGRIAGALAEITVIIIGAALSWLSVNYLYPIAGYLDQAGIWPFVAGFAIPMARYLYWKRKQVTG
jgi:hypothetical protein